MNDKKRGKQGEDLYPAKTQGVEVTPRNWLVPMILLALTEFNSYGYELMERTAAFGFEAMNPGTLYRTLRHMEKGGLCESRWENSKGDQHAECTPLRTLAKRTWISGPRR